jgi:hypothetical protein
VEQVNREIWSNIYAIRMSVRNMRIPVTYENGNVTLEGRGVYIDIITVKYSGCTYDM